MLIRYPGLVLCENWWLIFQIIRVLLKLNVARSVPQTWNEKSWKRVLVLSGWLDIGSLVGLWAFFTKCTLQCESLLPIGGLFLLAWTSCSIIIRTKLRQMVQYSSGTLDPQIPVDTTMHCPICWESMENDIVQLECSHFFHKTCWLFARTNYTNGTGCPLCNAKEIKYCTCHLSSSERAEVLAKVENCYQTIKNPYLGRTHPPH